MNINFNKIKNYNPKIYKLQSKSNHKVITILKFLNFHKFYNKLIKIDII